MKIYTRVVVEMFTWKVLEEESYEYTGPVALCGGGGTTVEAAPVDPAVTKLNQMNLNLNEQAIAQNAQLRPYQLQSMGLKETQIAQTPEQAAEYNRLAAEVAAYDASPNRVPNAMAGNLARMKELNPAATLSKMSDEEYYASLSSTEKQSYDLQKKAYDRAMLAYEGKLPISSETERYLTKNRLGTQEGLRQRLGMNYGLSTSGIQSEAELSSMEAGVRDAASRGDLTTAAALFNQGVGTGSGLTQQNYQNYTGYPSSTMGLSQGLTNAANPYLQQQNMQYQANVANAQNANQSRSGLMSGLGSLAGLAGGIGLASMTGGASLIPAAAGSIGGGFSKFGNSFSYL
jgi:hypothetical protein